MAFYGTKAEDDSVKTEACRWYVKGLGLQRNELQKASSPERGQLLDSTSVYCAISWTEPPIISNEEWCTVPFAIHGKDAYDSIDDVFLKVPQCVILRTRYQGLVASGRAEEADMLAPELEAAAGDLLERLDKWWFEWVHELNEPWTQSPPTTTSPSSPTSTTKFVAPKTFQSTFNASTIARFSSTSLIAYGMLRLVSLQKNDYAAEITAHGNSILSAFQYQERAGAAHTGVIAMLHPLVVLSFLAVSRRQRDAARAAMLVWGRARGVGKFVEGNIRDHV
ncbi:MAG: hypothetical protein Q9195_000707 [Heterodermia aff. obscurata]